jgi:hypothetical protein
MKLKPVQTYPAAELKGRIPGEAYRVLTAYAAHCRETSGQTIEVWALVVQMVEQFMDSDRDFQAWRRRTQNGPAAGPMAD